MTDILSSTHRSADITALITTYNQRIQATLLSTASAVLQKGLRVQIVIADDCSSTNLSQVYSQFLDYAGHTNYQVIRHNHNVKTVRNIANALPAVNSPIVKCFGAGDLLYSYNTLSDSASALSKSGASCGFGRILTFENNADGGRLFTAPRNPNSYSVDSSLTNRSKLFSNQMLNADWIPAGSQFWRTETLESILFKLSDVYGVRYCEDFAITLELFEGLPYFLDEPVLWYEFSGGISTGGNAESIKRLYADHEHFYSNATRTNPFSMRLYAARLGFDFRRFIALHTPIYRLLQAKVAASYQSATDTRYPYNELFREAHDLVNRFISTHKIKC